MSAKPHQRLPVLRFRVEGPMTAMVLRYWLQARDRERREYPWLPKRDRDLLALRAVAWRCTQMTNGLQRIIDKEVRKP
jgi:hypothetical protein